MSKSDIKNKQIQIQINTHNLNKNKKGVCEWYIFYTSWLYPHLKPFSSPSPKFLLWSIVLTGNWRDTNGAFPSCSWLKVILFVLTWVTIWMQDGGPRQGISSWQRRSQKGKKLPRTACKGKNYWLHNVLVIFIVVPLITHYPLYKRMAFSICVSIIETSTSKFVPHLWLKLNQWIKNRNKNTSHQGLFVIFLTKVPLRRRNVLIFKSN